MSPSCREVRDVLAVWSESTDLPEPIAVHLGACPACLSAFDRRFPPVAVPALAAPAPREVRDRLLRERPRTVSPVFVAAAAAAVVLVASSMLAQSARAPEVADLFPPDCPEEIASSLPECPPA